MSEPDVFIFDDREIYQPEDEPVRKPKLRRFKGDVRYRFVFESRDDDIQMFSPCKVGGCEGSATYGKPYCIDHLDRLPYVRAMKSDIEAAPEKSELLDMLD